MKTFAKIICYYGLIPFVSTLISIVALFFGLSTYASVIISPLVVVGIYLILRRHMDFKFAFYLNAVTLLFFSLIFVILMVISKGNSDGALVPYSVAVTFPLVPIWGIAMLMNQAMAAYLTIFFIYLSGAVLSFIMAKEKLSLKICITFFAVVVLLFLTAAIAYLNRPAAKYGGHGFKYMHGYSSTDLKDYTVYAKNSKLVPLPEEPAFKIEGVENMPVLDGAEACYPLYAAVAKALYQDIDVIEKDWLKDKENENPSTNGRVVTFTNTVVGFQRLLNGGLDYTSESDKADMFFGAKPSQSQLTYAKELGVEVDITPIGKEAFVFFVEDDNPVKNLTSEEVKKIYHGDITNWQEVGGKDSEIVAFQRPQNSGSQTMMVYFMGDVSLKEPKTYEMVDSMVGVIDHVAEYHNEEGALGYSFRYFIEGLSQEKNVKLLAIDGIEPTRENIENGSYPLTVNLCLVTRAGDDNPNIEKVKEFILSEQGQFLVYETGYGRLK